MKRIAVLISNKGTGTNLQAIIDGVNSKKINAVIEFLIFKCIKNIQAFQKLAKYYQKFITNFTEIITLLINLL